MIASTTLTMRIPSTPPIVIVAILFFALGVLARELIPHLTFFGHQRKPFKRYNPKKNKPKRARS